MSIPFRLTLNIVINIWPHAALKAPILLNLEENLKKVPCIIFSFQKNNWIDFPNSFPKTSCLGWAQSWNFIWWGRSEKLIKGKWELWNGNAHRPWKFHWLFVPGEPSFNNRKMSPSELPQGWQLNYYSFNHYGKQSPETVFLTLGPVSPLDSCDMWMKPPRPQFSIL